MTKPYKSQAIKVTSAINLLQEEVDKAHDIACLEKIHELIDEFITPQDSNEDKRLILFQIGLQANKIKYNDASSNLTLRQISEIFGLSHYGSVSNFLFQVRVRIGDGLLDKELKEIRSNLRIE